METGIKTFEITVLISRLISRLKKQGGILVIKTLARVTAHLCVILRTNPVIGESYFGPVQSYLIHIFSYSGQNQSHLVQIKSYFGYCLAYLGENLVKF